MANRKINELSPRTPSLTDLIIVGDPSTGYSFKATISVLAAFAGSNIQFSSLQGISITSPTNGQALVYDGTNWVNQSISVPVTSVFGRTGVVVAAEGDYSLDLLSDVTLTSPTTNQVLQYNGTAWVNATFVAGINSLNGLTATTQTFATDSSGSDFAITSTTSTHTFSLPTASAVNRGALSSADWSTFNGKQDAITLTTTGSSGASTLVGATLNVPEYTLAGLGGVSGSGTTNYLPKWTGSTALGNSLVYDDGTNVGIGTATPTNGKFQIDAGTSVPIVALTTNSDVARYFSSVTFAGFRVIAPINTGIPYIGLNTSSSIGTYTVGIQKAFFAYWSDNSGYASLGYGGSSHAIVYRVNNGNVIIGGGTTDGGYKLDVNGTARVQNNSFIQIRAQSTGSSGGIEFIPSSGNAYELQATTSSTFILYDRTAAAQRLTVNSSGYLGIGITTPVAQLDVNGGIIAYGTVPATRASSLINDYFSGVARITSIGANASTHGVITFNTAPSGTPTLTERMRIVGSTGNVLIGTTTDGGQKLQVSGTARVQGTGSQIPLTLTAASGANNTLVLNHAGNFNATQINNSSGVEAAVFGWGNSGALSPLQNTFYFLANTNNVASANMKFVRYTGGVSFATAIMIASDGKVGINNTSQSYQLDITGDLRATTSAYFATSSGSVGIGTTSPNASALLDITSTTKGFLPPRMTNAQMVAIATPASGLMVYDTTNNKLNVYDGTNWVAVH